jgi:hypothetical protein
MTAGDAVRNFAASRGAPTIESTLLHSPERILNARVNTRVARAVITSALVLACGSVLRAETDFAFVMDGNQVVPPTSSAAKGRAVARLSTDETSIEFVVEHDVLDPEAVEIRRGDFGSNGPIRHVLSSVVSPVVETWMPSAQDVQELKSGLLHVVVTSITFPAGEIRGQIAPKRNPVPGDVIVTEVMYRPASGGESGSAAAEWVELFNTTSSDIELTGWFFQDEDTSPTAPCTALVSGTIPSFVLRSFDVVVVIPDGSAAEKPSVADFRAAWGLGLDVDVVQLNSNGTTEGGLVAGGLDDSPRNDTIAENDLPLVAATWQPCNPAGQPRIDNEILTLNRGAQIIDMVNLGKRDSPGGPTDWPANTLDGSIALVPGDYPSLEPQDFSTYSESGNDSGANWIAHTHGDLAGGRRQARGMGVYRGRDVGSPGYLQGATLENQAPVAISQMQSGRPGETIDIELAATDASVPFFGLLLFIVRSLPAHGTLIDTTTGIVIMPSDIAGGGYLLPQLPLNTLRYINDGTCAIDAFEFVAFDGVLESEPAIVELAIQSGEVIMTELMYDPASKAENGETEWIELYNPGPRAVNLAGWHLAGRQSRGGDFPSYVLAPESAVVVIPPNMDEAEFVDAWCRTPLGDAPCPDNILQMRPTIRRVLPGQQFALELVQRRLSAPVRGMQAFIEYPETLLSFVGTDHAGCTGICPPDLMSPYNLLIRAAASGAQVDVALGIDDAAAQSATRFDGTLAELVFQAGNTTGSAGAIFRDAFPPARFADTNALPVDPCLIATAPIWIDNTPDDCPHNVLELRLAPGSSRVQPGEPVFLEVWQHSLSEPVRGLQLFATLDDARLAHVRTSFGQCSADSSPPCPTPYDLVIRNIVEAGLIDIAVGIDDASGQSPTSESHRIAVIEFEALTETGPTTVDFRVNSPPTRFVDQSGEEVLPCRIDAPVIWIEDALAIKPCPIIQPTAIDQTGSNGLLGRALSDTDDLILLMSPSGLSDAVAYRSHLIDSHWPNVYPPGGSIHVHPASQYNALANDQPTAWLAADAGLHYARDVLETPSFFGFDKGSPGQLAEVTFSLCTRDAVPFDGNGDGLIDLEDASHFDQCLQGPGAELVSNCDCLDADQDGDIDLVDFWRMQLAFYQ